MGVAGIEGVGFPGEMAVMPLGHSQQFYPIVLIRVTLDNLICAVSRAIADNDPFARQRRLRDDGANGLLDKCGFIASRSD